MTYVTYIPQAIIGSSVDEQALAQTELNHLLVTQAQAVAPTQDPLTSRDGRIIGEKRSQAKRNAIASITNLQQFSCI